MKKWMIGILLSMCLSLPAQGGPPPVSQACQEIFAEMYALERSLYWSPVHMAVRDTEAYRKLFTVSYDVHRWGVPWGGPERPGYDAALKCQQEALDEVYKTSAFSTLMQSQPCEAVKANLSDLNAEGCYGRRITRIPCLDTPNISVYTSMDWH